MISKHLAESSVSLWTLPFSQVVSDFALKSDVLLDEVRAGGRINLIIGRGLVTRARESLGLPPSTLFRTPAEPEDTGKVLMPAICFPLLTGDIALPEHLLRFQSLLRVRSICICPERVQKCFSFSGFVFLTSSYSATMLTATRLFQKGYPEMGKAWKNEGKRVNMCTSGWRILAGNGENSPPPSTVGLSG